MKLGRFEIRLARPKPNTDTEAGTSSSGEALFDGDLYDTSNIKIKDFDKMRRRDGTASALYNVLTLPILSNPWSIEADPDDKSGEQAKFVENALKDPPHRGGMTTPFDLVLADMLRATLEGYRAYEKVFTIRDGKFVFRKIASRDNRTLILREDDRGGFNGFKQQAYIGKKYKTVTVDKQYAYLFTFGKQFHWLKGESAFTAAYPIYQKKHRAYYLVEQALQQFAIPPKVGKAPKGAKQDQIDQVTAALNNLAVNSAVGLPPEWDAMVMSSTGRIDPMPYIDHLNAEMSRSILAHFMMLGTGSGGTGSWALSNDQSDMFLLALRGLMTQIEEHINSYLLPDLVDYNFERPAYPSFKFADLTDQTRDILKETFIKIVEKSETGTPEWFTNNVLDKMAGQLGIEVPEGEGNEKTVNQSRTKLARNKWKRALTPAEEKVQFEAIQGKFDELDKEFMDAVKPIFDELRADTVKRLDKILTAKDYKALDKFALRGADKYRKILEQQMLDAYLYAKQGASDEMDVKIPATPAETKALIKRKAKEVVDKQFQDILFSIKTEINNAVRKNQLDKTQLAVGDVLASIGGIISGFYADKTILTAGALINTAVNIGREDVFTKYKHLISKYQYSALLDAKTCPICEDLDATVVDEAEYRSTKWKPPIHFACRCIWVEILKDEVEQPEITGFPEEPGGTTDPTLSRTNEIEHPHQVPFDPVEQYKLTREIAERAVQDVLDEATGEPDDDQE